MRRAEEEVHAAAGKAAWHSDDQGQGLDMHPPGDGAEVDAADTEVAGPASGVRRLSHLPKGDASRNSAAAPSVVFCSSWGFSIVLAGQPDGKVHASAGRYGC